MFLLKLGFNAQSMLHGILIKSGILFAQIWPAERPLTVSGPFTGSHNLDPTKCVPTHYLKPSYDPAPMYCNVVYMDFGIKELGTSDL